MIGTLSLPRSRKLGHLPPEGPERKRGEPLRVAFPRHQRCQHAPPTHPEQVRDHGGHLDGGVLEDLQDPLRGLGAGLHQAHTRLRQIPPGLHGGWGNTTGPDQAMGEPFGHPARVGCVRLRAWPRPDLLGMAHDDLNEPTEQMGDRTPRRAGTFHGDHGTVLGEEPLAQGEQRTMGGTILPPLQTSLALVTDAAETGHHRGRMDIETTPDGVDDRPWGTSRAHVGDDGETPVLRLSMRYSHA